MNPEFRRTRRYEGTAPRRDFGRRSAEPGAHRLLRKISLLAGAVDAAERFDDLFYGFHLKMITENRYRLQAPSSPILCTALLSQMRHNRQMPDFAFDRDAVRRKMAASGVSQSELAEAVGLTHKSAVAKILDGNRRVKVEEAAKIYGYLQLVPAGGESTRSVPIIGFASAGRWREAVEVPIGHMVLPQHVAGARAFAVEVQGDSIDQIVDDGGWIVCDPDDKVLAAGKVYLLQNDQFEVTVKRYQKAPPRFEPVSNNTTHEAFLASDCDFVVLGRIVWKGSPL